MTIREGKKLKGGIQMSGESSASVDIFQLRLSQHYMFHNLIQLAVRSVTKVALCGELSSNSVLGITR